MKNSITGKAIGGQARAKNLSPDQRREIAKKAAEARWSKKNISEQASPHRENLDSKPGETTSEQASPHRENLDSKPGETTSEQASPHRENLDSKPGETTSEQASPHRENLDSKPGETTSEQASPHKGSSSIEVFGVEDIETSLGSDEYLPTAIHWGLLNLVGIQLPCYVLNNGQRIIGRAAANEMLTGLTKAGNFEQTISVKSLKPFLDAEEIISQFVAFRLIDVQKKFNISVKGLPADLLIDVCRGFVSALESSYHRPADADYPSLTSRQREMAVQASMFLGAVAKVGLDALIDEATGYQEVRQKDALEVKLRAYLEDEMRKWEKTFPDELWLEFGRLTSWRGNIHKRPKYWGKLVMELIYEYLDPDVAQWLREHAPKPRRGQNYHQWLSGQYGLKKLIEHIWMVIGMARACQSIQELKEKMALYFGKEPIQLTLTFSRLNTHSHE